MMNSTVNHSEKKVNSNLELNVFVEIQDRYFVIMKAFLGICCTSVYFVILKPFVLLAIITWVLFFLEKFTFKEFAICTPTLTRKDQLSQKYIHTLLCTEAIKLFNLKQTSKWMPKELADLHFAP